MSVVAAIRNMLSAGLTIDQALTAAEAFEAAQDVGEPVLTKRQSRNKRYYNRLKASENRLNKTIKTVSDVGAPSSSPAPLDPPPAPAPIIPQTPSPSSETKRARRLDESWRLPAAWGQWAIDQGFSEQVIRLEADKFRDFWCSKSGSNATKLDWFATWRNWMRNCSKAVGGPAPPAKPRSITDVLKSQVLEMQANGREAEEGYGTGEEDGFGQTLLGFAGSSG